MMRSLFFGRLQKCISKTVWFSRMLCSAMLLLVSVNVSASSTGLVVTGLGGNDAYAEQFSAQGKIIVDALRSLDDSQAAPAASDSNENFMLLQAENATRDSIVSAIEKLGAKSSSAFYLILIGHGTVDAETWRFNLTGDDLTTEDLVAALATVNAEQQLVLVGTSASGALLDVLNQPGRLVVTATKSAGELNAVRFPEYLAKAMETTVADTDRNEILTLAEVYRYTNEQTQKYYENQKLLASEHARILGDSAERLPLARLGSLRSAKDDPVVAELLAKRLVLEDEFLAIKAKKPDMPIVDYYEELESVLLSIARLQQEIDVATGWVGSNE